MTVPPEFRFIARHFAPLAGEGGLGLLDDAALLAPRRGRTLVLAADAMVENVHFLPDDPPGDLGRKLLRANLSDLAAMGADARFYLMTLSIPTGRDDRFFAAFAAGLARDQEAFGVTLLGGDTTGTAGPLVLSLTILGDVPRGAALRRSGARAGERLWVTGTIGDGALGLRALRGEVADPDGFLAGRYRLPEPRLGLALRGVARAAIDVSDGLMQDAGHLARASGVGIEIDAASVPLSAAARAAGGRWFPTCVTGGDDYELLFAADPADDARVRRAARRAGIAATPIGRVVAGEGVVMRGPDGAPIVFAEQGWSHIPTDPLQ